MREKDLEAIGKVAKNEPTGSKEYDTSLGICWYGLIGLLSIISWYGILAGQLI